MPVSSGSHRLSKAAKHMVDALLGCHHPAICNFYSFVRYTCLAQTRCQQKMLADPEATTCSPVKELNCFTTQSQAIIRFLGTSAVKTKNRTAGHHEPRSSAASLRLGSPLELNSIGRA